MPYVEASGRSATMQGCAGRTILRDDDTVWNAGQRCRQHLDQPQPTFTDVLLLQAEKMLLAANGMFNDERHQDASDVYSEAINLLEAHAGDELKAPTKEERMGCTPTIRKLIAKLFLNRSVVRLNLGLYSAAKVDNRKCRRFDPHFHQMQKQCLSSGASWTIAY